MNEGRMADRHTAGRAKLPASIWALGFVSLFMDISSEMIHGLLPVFLVTALHASVGTVGVIEGIGEATASISKLFSGWVSDRIGKRKALTLVGYGLGALSKPLFAVAPAASWVLAARFTDRVGKGIRGAPRDALIGDLVPREVRGAAYGLRQSLDTVGAFAGPLLAIALMALLDDDFRLVFWIAIIPGLVSVAVLALGVREPAQHRAPREREAAIRWREFRRLGRPFRTIVIVGAILTLARFSEAFLVLRAEGAGLPVALAPLVLVVMNIVYAASAYPAGVLSDRLDRRRMLVVGFAVLVLADAALAVAPGLAVVMLGVGLWGLHMGLTQGLLAALVADTAPAALRGTAFGLFNLASGIALLIASLVAGLLWQWFGPYATFAAGAGFTAAGLAGAMALARDRVER
jgi:MFS family permease